jgi:hypothetical protein
MIHWWISQQPPVPGLLRAVFYAGLLALCLVDHPSPLDAPRLIARTDRRLYTPPLALTVLGIRWVRPPLLRVVRALTIAAWIAAAAGFAQPLSGALTLIGFAFLHAVNSGALGSNHSTHAALYALFCMSFSVSYDGPTLDSLLAEHTSWPLLAGHGSVLESGFAPTLLLVALAYVMFAGGVSKLRNGGRAWLYGRSLRFYIRESSEFARAPFVSRFVVAAPRLCGTLAVLTVVVELSAPLVFLDPGLRLAFVLGWCALHVGILLVMMPAYWVQMWCYVLVLDWYRILGLGPSTVPEVHAAGAGALSAFGVAFCGVLLIVLVRHVEQWPFTSVPMYSNGVAPSDVSLPTRDELHARAVRAAHGRVSAWPRPWISTEIMEDVRLVPTDGGPPTPLFDAMAEQDRPFVRWSQYAKVVRSVAIADLAAKPADQPDDTGPQHPAGQLLGDLAQIVRDGLPEWWRYERIELVCNTASGWLVTGSVPLAGDPPAWRWLATGSVRLAGDAPPEARESQLQGAST